MTGQITLSVEIIRLLSPVCKAEIAAHLGLSTAEEPSFQEDEAGEYAELGLQAARVFLQGCSEKTRTAVRCMVSAGEEFSMSKLESEMGVEAGQLRGVWAGLTKRVRTVTGDDHVSLIKWNVPTEGGDWIGRLMPVTREAFRRALAEQ